MKQLKLNYQPNNIEEIVDEIKSSEIVKNLIDKLNISEEEILLIF